MSDPKAFIARSPSRRRAARRAGAADRRADAASQNLPAVIAAPAPAPSKPTAKAPAEAAVFAAQLMGQDGQKRGLRGGPEVIDKARSSYLGTEWSGPADRRPAAGRIAKTEV